MAQELATSIHIGKDEYKKIKLGETQAAQIEGGVFARINEWVIEKSPVKMKEKVTFFRLLATMINAGVSLVKSLSILQEQTEDLKMKRICEKLISRIEVGQTLSQGLELYPDIFLGAEIGMIRSGEASGRLNQVLLTLADQTEKNAKIKGKIKGAMMYPMAIVFVIVAVFTAVSVLVIPKMKTSFEEVGAELPKSTQVMIGISDFLMGKTFGIPNPAIVIACIILFNILLSAWKKTHSGKFYWDKFLLAVPIFGNLRRKLILAQFARSLSTLTQSGISIVKALRITSEVVGNEVYRRRILLIAEDVKQGITIGENLQGNRKMFPVMLVSMISVGEQTAQLDNVTGKVAEFYEDEVETMVKTLSSLMEPFIIILIGVVVGFMVTAIMSPIMKMSELATEG